MVKSAMETTGIGGDLQAVRPRIEPEVVFQKVVDATNAQREAGVVHPEVVVAVQVVNGPELLVTGDRVPAAAVQGVAIQEILVRGLFVRELVAQEVPVPAPFEGMSDA